MRTLTFLKYFKPKKMTTRDHILQIARAEIGTTESPKGTNAVKYNEWFYGRAVSDTSKYKYYWCMTFVSWVFAQAGVALFGHDYPKGFCSVPNCLAYYRKMGETTTDPQPGDIVIYDWQKNPDKANHWNADHVGIFVRWIVKGKILEVIEGNTSADDIGSQSNGDGVFLKSARKIEHVQEFISPKTLAA